MSDPIAQAAEALSAVPSGTEPTAVSVGIESKTALASAPLATGNVVNETPVVAAPEVAQSGEATMADAAAAQSAGSSSTQASSQPSESTSELVGATGSEPSPLLASQPGDGPSRESLLLRMHAAIDELEAKIASGVHVFAHEVAALRDHILKVL